ncbi:hypothetical protein U1Q18_009155, partial [Sarracenia purpurea var. burkii]
SLKAARKKAGDGDEEECRYYSLSLTSCSSPITAAVDDASFRSSISRTLAYTIDMSSIFTCSL